MHSMIYPEQCLWTLSFWISRLIYLMYSHLRFWPASHSQQWMVTRHTRKDLRISKKSSTMISSQIMRTSSLRIAGLTSTLILIARRVTRTTRTSRSFDHHRTLCLIKEQPTRKRKKREVRGDKLSHLTTTKEAISWMTSWKTSSCRVRKRKRKFQ